MRDKVQRLSNGPRPENGEGPIHIVDMEDEEAVELFETLGTQTTYQIYNELQHEPQTPSELADSQGGSLQNIHYHIEKLETAGLIEPVDTWYSEKGVEMSVYAPTHNPLVISFGTDSSRSRLRTVLTRAFGGIGIVAATSLIVEYAVNWWQGSSESQLGTEISTVTTNGESAQPSVVDVIVNSPGLTVFVLGLLVIMLYTIGQLRN